LEKDLLDGGAFESDPFRLLKVSDFHPVGPCRTKIIYAVNEKKQKNAKYRAGGPYQILEVIEPGAVFVGTIQVLPPLSSSIIKTPLTEPAVLESAASFYGKEKRREDEELMAAGLPHLRREHMEEGVPLRIGRHCGAESLTIDGQRRIRIMQGRDKQATVSTRGATTFWLAAEEPRNYQKRPCNPSAGRSSAGYLLKSHLSWPVKKPHHRRCRNAKEPRPRLNIPWKQLRPCLMKKHGRKPTSATMPEAGEF